MRSILSFAFLLTFIGIKSQNNLVVFTENGEKFFLVVNGIKQNIEAETNVKVTDLIQPQYKVKVVFEDKAKGVVDQNIWLMNGGESVKNHEFVYSVKVNKKAGYKIRFVSSVAVSETKPSSDQTVVHYTTTEPTAANNNVVTEGATTNINMSSSGNVNTNVNVAEPAGSIGTNVQVTETTTQTQVNNGTPGGANVGINMNGMGVNININDNMGGGMNNTTSTTVTSKTITTTSTTKSSVSATTNGNATAVNTKPAATSKGEVKTKNDPLPGYTGAKGCTSPISTAEFANVKKSIDTKNFEDTKIKIAKQVIDNNCLLSSQVKEIMMLFNFEETRLDLAKYAYGHTYDIGNYYKLNDAFKFETSIDELNEYIKSNDHK